MYLLYIHTYFYGISTWNCLPTWPPGAQSFAGGGGYHLRVVGDCGAHLARGAVVGDPFDIPMRFPIDEWAPMTSQ